MEVDTEENAWELSKENVQPLKTGRRMGDLRKALKSDPTILQREAQQFELELRNTKDPYEKLDVWCKYIAWREQNYTCRNADTMKLMQQCIVFYKENKEFHQNEQYISVWIKLTETLDTPNDVFTFMYDNDIGTSFAVFYKNYAENLELLGSIKRADEIYCLGIFRNAEPVEILKEAKRNFEHRMAKRQAGLPVDDNEPPERTRKVLGALKPIKAGKVGNDRIKNQSSSKVRIGSTAPSKSTGKSGFEIYGENSSSSTSMLPSGTRQMKHIPVDAIVNRENTKEMTKLKGTKIRNAGGSSNAVTNFEIYHEETKTEVSQTPKQVVVSSRKPLSSRKHQDPENPFYNKTEDSNPVVVSKYCKNLVYMGNKEMSFEELKALQPKYQHSKHPVENCTRARAALNFNSQQQSNEQQDVSMTPTKKYTRSNDIIMQHQNTPTQIQKIMRCAENEATSTLGSTQIFKQLDNTQNLESDREESRVQAAKKLGTNTDVEMLNNHETPTQILEIMRCSEKESASPVESTAYYGPRKQELDFRDGIDVSCIVPNDETRRVHNDITKKLEGLETTQRLQPIQNQDNDAGINDMLENLELTQRIHPLARQNDLADMLTELETTQKLPPVQNQGNDEKINYMLENLQLTQQAHSSARKKDVADMLSELDTTQRLPPVQNQDNDEGINEMLEKSDITQRVHLLARKKDVADILSELETTQRLPPFQSQDNDEDINDVPENLGFAKYTSKDDTNRFKDNGYFSTFQDGAVNIRKTKPKETGFSIFQDEGVADVNKAKPKDIGFSIFQDKAGDISKTEPNDTSFGIFTDETADVSKAKPKETGFSIFTDETAVVSKVKPKNTGFDIFQDGKHDDTDEFDVIGIFNDPTAALKKFNSEEGFSIFPDENTGKDIIKSKAKDLDFSIFKDDATLTNINKNRSNDLDFSIFKDETTDVSKIKPKNSGISIFQDEEPATVPRSTVSKGLDMFSDTQTTSFNNQDVTCGKDTSTMFNEEKTEKFSKAHIQVPASTPAVRSFIGHVTFGANISAFSPQESLNLSTIHECSGESEYARRNSENEHTSDSIPTNQISCLDPFNNEIKSRLVERVMSHITSDDGFLDINGPIPQVDKQTTNIILGPRHIHISKGISRHRDGLSVYKARYTGTNENLALKVVDQSIAESKANLWNFYISRTIHERLNTVNAGPEYHKIFMNINFTSVYSNALCFEAPFYNTGTLNDLINLYKKHSRRMDEALALLYSYEILNTVSVLHQLKILHCNLHPTKFLLGDRERIEDGPLSICALTMTSFKNSVDLTLLPQNMKFIGRSKIDSYESPSMRNNEPWGPEVDYYAAAAVIHELVFQSAMNTYYDNKKKLMRICNIPPNDWNEQLWSYLFSTLINGANSIDDLLQVLRQRLSDPEFYEKLDAAIQSKEDLLMDDDD